MLLNSCYVFFELDSKITFIPSTQNVHPTTPKFPSTPTKRTKALTPKTLATEMLYGTGSSAGHP